MEKKLMCYSATPSDSQETTPHWRGRAESWLLLPKTSTTPQTTFVRFAENVSVMATDGGAG